MLKCIYLPSLIFFLHLFSTGFAQIAKSFYIPESQYNVAFFYMPDHKTGKPTEMTRKIIYTQGDDVYDIEDSKFYRNEVASSMNKTISFVGNQVKLLKQTSFNRFGQEKSQSFNPAQTIFILPEVGKVATWINTVVDQKPIKYVATWTTVSIQGRQRKAIEVTHKSPFYDVYTIEYYVPEIGLWKHVNQAEGQKQVFSKLQSLSFDDSIAQIVAEKEDKQEPEPKRPIKEEVYTVVEKAAQFPGGQTEMNKFIKQSMKYPAAAHRANVQGKVFLSVVIRSNGKIDEIQVAKGLGFGCDEEAYRVTKSMPLWVPAMQSGKNVSSRYNLTVEFTLDQ